MVEKEMAIIKHKKVVQVVDKRLDIQMLVVLKPQIKQHHLVGHLMVTVVELH